MRLTNKNQPTFSGKSWCYGGKIKLMLDENKIEEVMDNSIGKKCWLKHIIIVNQPTKGL